MASWGEEEPGREYAEAAAKGDRALERLMDRRYRREERYWAPIRAAREAERLAAERATVEQERENKAAYMRRYRAQKAARRRELDQSKPTPSRDLSWSAGGDGAVTTPC
jgi:hypothetical protein